MMRHVPLTITPLGCATLLFLVACTPAQEASPTPSASSTASPSPTSSPTCPGHGGRWAMVVLYEERGACRHVAGPTRIVACQGEDVTWRIFNQCRGTHTLMIDGFVYSKDDPGIPKSGEEYPSSPPPNAEPNGPFEPGRHSTSLKPDTATDLTLRVQKEAVRGFYRYYTILDSKPDADQQIEVP
jgi:hypothetical protein